MIEEQTVRARAIDGDLGWTQGGKAQVAVTFEILEGEDAGRNITWYGYFSDASKERTIEALRYCGWKGDDISDMSSINGEGEASIVIEHEEYEGKTRAKVQWVNNGGGARLAKPMEDDEKKAFAEKMKGLVASVDAKSKSRGGPAPSGGGGGGGGSDSPPPISDDDIPF
jgi:hypothetical protein